VDPERRTSLQSRATKPTPRRRLARSALVGATILVFLFLGLPTLVYSHFCLTDVASFCAPLQRSADAISLNRTTFLVLTVGLPALVLVLSWRQLPAAFAAMPLGGRIRLVLFVLVGIAALVLHVLFPGAA
jgi:hypothetical protein